MRFLLPPETSGPRVRTGALWFFVALAAVTSGRYWTALLWSLVAGVAGYQLVGAWQVATDHRRSSSSEGHGTGRGSHLLAFLGAATIPLAASYSTGATGLALVVIPLLVVALHVMSGERPVGAAPAVIGVVIPAIAAVSVVFAVRMDVWAGIFLILGVSLYDAGSYLLGADAGSRWEGPVAGVIGALAVTFTMSAFHPSPFDVTSAWITGVVMAVSCPLGQWLASVFLPSPDADVRGIRRIDAYLVAGPVFVVCAAAASL